MQVRDHLNHCTNCVRRKIKCLDDLNVMQHRVEMRKTTGKGKCPAKRLQMDDDNDDKEDGP